MKSILIKDTTREEREKIVSESISCGEGTCENCSSCHLGGGNALDMYRDYIEGRKEISQINSEFRTKYLH